LTTVSPSSFWRRRARTTTPAAFSASSGVSKKNTWRNCESSGSTPSALAASARALSWIVSLSSTLSAPRTRVHHLRAGPRSDSVVVSATIHPLIDGGENAPPTLAPRDRSVVVR
jgi:hypothetical protein